MQKFGPLFLACLLLAGCGQSSTPLSHALSALRAGDHDDFLTAKAEAEQDVKGAIQPGADLCLVSGADIAKYSALSRIQKLDRPDVFALPEEERLLYALKVAGEHSMIPMDTFLADAPIATAGTSHVDEHCGAERDKVLQAMMAGGNFMIDDDEARSAILEGWIADLKNKHGAKFDDDMSSASGHLENAGYDAPWPAKTHFADQE